MNIILLQIALSNEESELLIKEFPQYLFLPLKPASYKNLSDENWARIEVFFGNQLTAEECKKARQLRWIQSTSPQITHLDIACLDKEALLLTTTGEENITQTGEFVLANILAFAKNLFHWHSLRHTPALVWDSKWRDSMWSLKDRTLLQIGLDDRGTEIARKCREMGMHVTGVSDHKTLHPYCQETLSFSEMHQALPTADVVCLCLPQSTPSAVSLGETELALMKQDAILIVLGSHRLVDENALALQVDTHKLRGVLFDGSYQTPPAPHSRLWSLPNVLITPEIAQRPKSVARASFHTFLYNLRQYSHGNFKDMRNLRELM